ncbi:MAG: SpoIIE family protein phosphatase [Solirubrobacteraceae bacterium]
MTLVSAESGRVLDRGDVELVEQIAARAAVSIENSRLYSERPMIAHTLQQNLLPARADHARGRRASAADPDRRWRRARDRRARPAPGCLRGRPLARHSRRATAFEHARPVHRGMTDAIGPDRERYGLARLRATLDRCRELPARRVIDALTGALQAFEVGEHADDAAALAIRRIRLGGSGERAPESSVPVRAQPAPTSG